MTDEQIEKQVAETTPMKQQILKDVFKTINRGIDAWSGKTAENEEPEEPEEPEVDETPQETARKTGEIPAEVEQTAPAPVEEE